MGKATDSQGYMEMLKVFKVCGVNQPVQQFVVRRGRQGLLPLDEERLRKVCQECRKVRARKYNPQVTASGYTKRYYLRKRERTLAKNKRWRDRNRAQMQAIRKQWLSIHPRFEAERAHQRRTQRLRGVSRQELIPAWQTAAELTERTGIRHHVDHIVPVRNQLVCGLHVPANLRVIPAEENQRKGNRFQPIVIAD